MTKHAILIIDDEELIRESMKDIILEMLDVTIHEATNGLEGLKMIFEQPVHVVVLDLNMPRMNGYEFMEHLDKRWGTERSGIKKPPIMVMTAIDFRKDLGAAAELGAKKFMNKPFQALDFVAAISELLKTQA